MLLFSVLSLKSIYLSQKGEGNKKSKPPKDSVCAMFLFYIFFSRGHNDTDFSVRYVREPSGKK